MTTDFIATLILLFLLGILTYLLIEYYRKYVNIYSEFPNVIFFIEVLRSLLAGKIPKDVPVTSYSFQVGIETCKRFQTEGLCVIWTTKPNLFIFSEEIFKVFSNTKNNTYKPYETHLLKDVFQNNLLTLEGDQWKKHRKMLNPVFYISNLKGKTQLMNKNASLLVENLSKYDSGTPPDILKLLNACTYRTIYEYITGLKLSQDENDPEMKEFIEWEKVYVKKYINRILKPWLHPRCVLPFFSEGRLYLKYAEKGLAFGDKVLEKMKQSFLRTETKYEEKSNEISGNPRRSLAQIMIERHETDLTYTTKDMDGEINGLLSAGYDTTSHSVMYTLHLLGHHPDVQDQVYEEVKSVKDHNNELSYDDLKNLKYLECVIKESLRLYPIIPVYGRRTVQGIQCGKYAIPKGTNIVLFIYLMHRDPAIFPDPEKFHPERFSSEKKPMIYPFGEGTRDCIGKHFAMMQMKIIIAHVIKNFKVISLDRQEDIQLSWEVFLSTVKPLRINFTPRRRVFN